MANTISPFYSSRSHPVYHSFPNQPQTKHSCISYFPFSLTPPSPPQYSQSSPYKAYPPLPLLPSGGPAHSPHISCNPFWYSAPSQEVCTLLKAYKYTLTNLLIGTTGTHQRHSGRSCACFQANSWTIGYMSLLTHIISMKAFLGTSQPPKSHRWGGCLPPQPRGRPGSTKKSWLLGCKAKETQFSGWFWFPSFYEGPYSALEENKSEIHCVFHAAVSNLVFKQKLKYACKQLGAFWMEYVCDSPRLAASTRHMNSMFSPVTDFGNPWCMEAHCKARNGLEVLTSDAIHWRKLLFPRHC